MADLAQFPYPFAADCFDAIYLNDVIEHLPDTIAVMEELYRVCAPEARVYIRVINWNSQYNAMDPTHVRLFHEHTFNFFGTFKDRAYYSTARFDVVNHRPEIGLFDSLLIGAFTFAWRPTAEAP